MSETQLRLQEMMRSLSSGTLLLEGYERDRINTLALSVLSDFADEASVEVPLVLGRESVPSQEEIRTMISRLRFSPRGKRFVVLLGADRLLAEGANALLKTLEEPQSMTLFLLTALPYAVLPTIRSRCIVLKSFESSTKLSSARADLPSLIEQFHSLDEKDSRELRGVLESFLATAEGELLQQPKTTRAVVLHDALKLLAKKNISKIEIQNIFLRWNYA